MSKTYHEALAETLADAQPATGTRAQLEAALAGINEQLKGPLSNAERIMLCGDRADIRAALATTKATNGVAQTAITTPSA